MVLPPLLFKDLKQCVKYSLFDYIRQYSGEVKSFSMITQTCNFSASSVCYRCYPLYLYLSSNLDRIVRRKQMGMQRAHLLFPVDKMESYVKNLKGEPSCSIRTRRTVPATPPPLPLPLSVHKVSQNWHLFVTLAKVWLLFCSFLYILLNTAHVIDTLPWPINPI